MDDEPMWAADRVVAPTPASAITIPETANEFSIKGNVIKIFYHGLNKTTQETLNAAAGGIFLYKTPNKSYQLLEYKVLLKLDWAKNQKSKPSLKRIVAFADEGPSNSDTDKVMARMDVITIKIDAQYKELQSRPKQPTLEIARKFQAAILAVSIQYFELYKFCVNFTFNQEVVPCLSEKLYRKRSGS
ncbi:hypothetical protein Tco_0862207 [Tanacetum coccineum]